MTDVWVVQSTTFDSDPIVMCVCDERDLAIEKAKEFVMRDNGWDDDWTYDDIIVSDKEAGYNPGAVSVSDGSFSSSYVVFMEHVLTRELSPE